MRPIVIAAGGTGGHVFPAEALAAALIDRGHRVVLMTDARSGALHSPVFAVREHHVLQGAGIAGRGLTRAARAAASLAAGTWEARRILKDLDAGLIAAFGGYPSIPPVLAAASLRRRPRIILHEQNAVLGRANRFLAPRADLLALGFAHTARVPTRTPMLFTGNPVRPAIQALSGAPAPVLGARIELLILGGSLGARVFGSVVPAAIAALPEALRRRIHVVQQCRPEDLDRVRAVYLTADVSAELAVFFNDVAERLGAAHLVVSRAGASSCAEIAVAGRPCILVPLPGAIDDHQTANARALPGALIMRQGAFSATALSAALETMLSDPKELARTASHIATAGRPRAAADLADAVENLLARTVAAP